MQHGESGLEAAIIVAHGQPSAPGPADAEIIALAGRVARFLPGWRVEGATLAAEGALARAVAACAGRIIAVYPMFMADGWFTTVQLPARLAEAGADKIRQLPAFGLDPAVQRLTVDLARQALSAGTTDAILLAAHGSGRSPAPARVADDMARRIAAETGANVEAGFIEQDPRIAEVARRLGPKAICIPYFAARGGHVLTDLPEALGEGGFAGTLLDPVGCQAAVPQIIADRLRRG